MWNYFLHCVRNKQKDTLLSFRSIRLAANHYQLANRRTLYDFLRQSLKLKNNSKNFRDFEKCEFLHNQAMYRKSDVTHRKPTKFTFDNFRVISAILEKFEDQISCGVWSLH